MVMRNVIKRYTRTALPRFDRKDVDFWYAPMAFAGIKAIRIEI